MAVTQRISRGRRYYLIILVLAAITLVTISIRDGNHGILGSMRARAQSVIHPVQTATQDALRPLGNFLTGALHYQQLRRENALLRQELAQSQTQQVTGANAQAEARQLLAEAHLPFVGSIPTVTAAVINQSSSNFEEAIQINRGTANGLTDGMPVVAAGGLVGSIATVSSHDATVVLLTDPTFNVGVRIGSSNAVVGDATGEGRGNDLRVANVPLSVKVTKGEALSTSGLSLEKFPPGIPVGRVASVKASPDTLESTLELTPLVNPYDLLYVQVMLWSPQG